MEESVGFEAQNRLDLECKIFGIDDTGGRKTANTIHRNRWRDCANHWAIARSLNRSKSEKSENSYLKQNVSSNPSFIILLTSLEADLDKKEREEIINISLNFHCYLYYTEAS